MKKTIGLITAVIVLLASTAINAAATFEEELGRVIVTATRIAQHDYKITGNVTVIDKEQIEASNAQTLPDILNEALGVFVRNQGTVKTSKIDIRGFGDTAASNVLFLVNDRKMNSVDLSGPDLTQIPVESIERIEIIRGAGSVLYGDNAVGGVVNIITKKGEGKLSGRVGTRRLQDLLPCNCWGLRRYLYYQWCSPAHHQAHKQDPHPTYPSGPWRYRWWCHRQHGGRGNQSTPHGDYWGKHSLIRKSPLLHGFR